MPPAIRLVPCLLAAPIVTRSRDGASGPGRRRPPRGGASWGCPGFCYPP
jgi:hypothetical protein